MFVPLSNTDGTSKSIGHETKYGKIGVLICFDQWFPEAARIMALKGAELIVYPTAIGWGIKDNDDLKNSELDAWVTVQRGHAIFTKTQVFVL